MEIISSDRCVGCSACMQICPKKAITMVENKEGFYLPVIDETKCINCGICKKICPILNIHGNNKFAKKYYYAWNLDHIDRINSSSGGIFSQIAKYFYQKGGIVYGASFDDDLILKHIKTTNENELKKITGSKYIQSNIIGIYTEIKNELDNGENVLFVGTPCQVSGLNSFLKKKYQNLLTCDFVCHGVPSQKVFNKYINDFGFKIKNCEFRNKTNGWKNFSVKLTDEFGDYLIEKYYDNIYMKGFLNNLFLRKSCYNCSFSNMNRVSDITLGDYWGIENCEGIYYDGVSIIIINTAKGEEMFNNIKVNLNYKEIDLISLQKNNSCLCFPVKYNKKREKFFKNIDKQTFTKNASHLLKKGVNLKDKIKKLFRRIKWKN